jgi:hypothetical protein
VLAGASTVARVPHDLPSVSFELARLDLGEQLFLVESAEGRGKQGQDCRHGQDGSMGHDLPRLDDAER